MRTQWKRVIILLLVFCLALPLIVPTALAAEMEASVTIGTGVKEKPRAEITVKWDDGWFASDADAYRHELAVTSMALSAAAYTFGGVSVRAALKAFGFDHVTSYNYQLSAQSIDQTAYVFAVKTVKDQRGKAVKLVAIIVRGTGEYTEWAGNLNVGTGSEHEGFARARDELVNNLEKYLSEAGVTGKAKFLVAGHSRGGAAANLTAARLTDAGMAEKKDVYAYTFAAPAVSTEAKTEGYENIFNIVNEEDLVPQVPLAQWGCRRYGVDRPLPSRRSGGSAYDEQFAAMSRQYEALTGRPYAVYQDEAAVEKMTSALYQLIPTVSGVNMAMISALLRGDMEGLSALVEGNALAALLMGRTAMRVSSELTPLIQREGAGLVSAHCMAGYYSWLTACPAA